MLSWIVTIHLLFPLGGGSSLIFSIPFGEGGAFFSYGGASNKVTTNVAWVFDYWGLYDTSIVISYKAKSSASFEHRWCTKASTALGIISDSMNVKIEWILN